MTKKTQNSTGIEKNGFLHLLSRNQIWWTVIHFHPCNPALVLQTTASVLLYRIFSTHLAIFLVAFDDIAWKSDKQNFVISLSGLSVPSIERTACPYLNISDKIKLMETLLFCISFNLYSFKYNFDIHIQRNFFMRCILNKILHFIWTL